MSSKTLKEFAQEIKLDKKKLEDKLRYQKKFTVESSVLFRQGSNTFQKKNK